MPSATIRAIRDALGLSAESFGEGVSVSGRTVRAWEAGTAAPSPEAELRIQTLERDARQYVGASEVYIDERMAELRAGGRREWVALVRYRRLEDMLPEGRPRSIALHHAGLAAIRLRYGEHIVIVDWNADSYRKGLRGREDTTYTRGEWAARVARSEAI